MKFLPEETSRVLTVEISVTASALASGSIAASFGISVTGAGSICNSISE